MVGLDALIGLQVAALRSLFAVTVYVRPATMGPKITLMCRNGRKVHGETGVGINQVDIGDEFEEICLPHNISRYTRRGLQGWAVAFFRII